MIVWVLLIAATASLLCSTAAQHLQHFSRARLAEAARLLRRTEWGDQLLLRTDAYQQAWGAAGLLWGLLAAALLVLQLVAAEWSLGYALAAALIGLVGCYLLLPILLQRWFDESLLLRAAALLQLLGLPGRLFPILSRLCTRQLEAEPSDQENEAAEEILEAEIRSMVSAGQRDGLIENNEREMIESVIDLADAVIAEIMTPRTEMLTIQVDTGWEELVRIVGDSGHSRLPVHGKSRDEIVGVLHIKDLLSELARTRQARRPLRTLLRRPFFVPETKPVSEMLQEFQRGRTHIAIVLDEYGGVSGLVTIEDVLEEIVGEIADEHDDALVDGIKQLDENTWEAHARVHLTDCNERLGIDLAGEESFDTLAGFVFHELGRIPLVGETFERSGVRIKILDANRRRIDRLLIEKLPPQEAANNGSEPNEAKAGENSAK